MKSKLLYVEEGRRTYGLVMERHKDVFSELKQFSRKTNLSASHFTGLGGLEKVVLSNGIRNNGDGERIPVRGQCNIISMKGRLGPLNGNNDIQINVVLNNRKGKVYGGKLVHGEASPKMEVIIEEDPRYLQKRQNIR